MKKIVRILGLSLVLVSVMVSCEKDDVQDGPLAPTQQSLEGTYKIKTLDVPVAVDLDKDGKVNTNLLLETGKSCVWDNTWEFRGPAMFIKDGVTKCDPSSPDTILTESFEFNATTKTIKFASGDTLDYTNVEINVVNGKKEITFKTNDLSINQVRTFLLVQL